MTAWDAARGPTRLTVGRMISALLNTHPGPDADAHEQAGWWQQRAEVFERVTSVNEADGDVVRAGEARAAASEARAKASDLLEEAARDDSAGSGHPVTASEDGGDIVHLDDASDDLAEVMAL